MPLLAFRTFEINSFIHSFISTSSILEILSMPKLSSTGTHVGRASSWLISLSYRPSILSSFEQKKPPVIRCKSRFQKAGSGFTTLLGLVLGFTIPEIRCKSRYERAGSLIHHCDGPGSWIYRFEGSGTWIYPGFTSAGFTSGTGGYPSPIFENQTDFPGRALWRRVLWKPIKFVRMSHSYSVSPPEQDFLS